MNVPGICSDMTGVALNNVNTAFQIIHPGIPAGEFREIFLNFQSTPPAPGKRLARIQNNAPPQPISINFVRFFRETK